jgi:hypothetical protein
MLLHLALGLSVHCCWMQHATLPCAAQHMLTVGDLLLDEALGGGGAALHHLVALGGAGCAAIGRCRCRFRSPAACLHFSTK